LKPEQLREFRERTMAERTAAAAEEAGTGESKRPAATSKNGKQLASVEQMACAWIAESSPLQPGFGKWTAAEDDELRALVRNDGPEDWQKKSSSIGPPCPAPATRSQVRAAASAAADGPLVDMIDAPSGEEEEEAECQARRNAGHDG
jgi:hypothetical protein